MSALDREHRSGVAKSTAAREAYDAALGLMHELLAQSKPGASEEAYNAEWRERYETAVQQLAGAGIKTRRDSRDGADTYIRLRLQWNPKLRQLARNMLFQWDHF